MMEEKVDDKDFAVCNHYECSQKDECRRYDKSILATYNFANIYESGFNCFVRKEIPNGVSEMS